MRLGLYQLFLLQTPEHAAVYETVELGRREDSILSSTLFLRNALRRKEELLENASRKISASEARIRRFLIDRWTQNFGAENTAALCDWNNRPAPIYARINRLKISDEDFLAKHSRRRTAVAPENFVRLTTIPNDALAAGDCYIQDPSTAAACVLLDPQPGERVLDACAAPGGKTAISRRADGKPGLILVACDRDEGRIRTLQDNLERLGVGIAQFARHDWTSGEPLPDAAAFSPFDRILVDAPCSNTGVMRRRVDLRWRLAAQDFLRMREEQLRILRATIPLLETGGVLVYSTCSIEPEENEEVVQAITQEFPFLELVDAGVGASVSGRVRWRLCGEIDSRRSARRSVCIPHRRWNHYPLCMTRALISSRKFLVEYSTRLKRNETVLIETLRCAG